MKGLPNGRRLRKGEREKHLERKQARRDAAKRVSDGAGSRDIDNPQRHHR
jgi:hypothetical protein